MGLQTLRAQRKARAKGAWAGAPEVADLWELNKRELIELALRFADSTPQVSAAKLRAELNVLRAAGIV